jgi:hypothetical protein
MQDLHQAQQVPAPPAAEFYRIHALSYKVQAQATGPDIFERAPAHLLRVRRHAAIFQDNLESIPGLAISRHMNPAEGSLDGPFCVTEVSMADNICQRFVDRKNHRAAFGLGKSQLRRQFAQGVPHHAEHLRIAPQFHFE